MGTSYERATGPCLIRFSSGCLSLSWPPSAWHEGWDPPSMMSPQGPQKQGLSGPSVEGRWTPVEEVGFILGHVGWNLRERHPSPQSEGRWTLEVGKKLLLIILMACKLEAPHLLTDLLLCRGGSPACGVGRGRPARNTSRRACSFLTLQQEFLLCVLSLSGIEKSPLNISYFSPRVPVPFSGLQLHSPLGLGGSFPGSLSLSWSPPPSRLQHSQSTSPTVREHGLHYDRSSECVI